MGPALAALVDMRHSSSDYGNAFALFETALCLSFMFGPPIGGYLVRIIGFQWTLAVIAVLDILYAPLLFFLRV
ncbi:unnamed protein product [Adineta steineri]|uniref:Major facilitator superfamily (MFS) profile domain-containing protein n=1 Tax=Adineta steineri TaxID=433720 RepID=A0A819GVX0_9BILA|nr:unnamed protein product [Adineta steineri]CAF3888103.1 unnamed protein product [Adineta steineri]